MNDINFKKKLNIIYKNYLFLFYYKNDKNYTKFKIKKICFYV